jgi:hypothetical protein
MPKKAGAIKKPNADQKMEAKELHKPVIRKFPRRMVIVPGIWHTFAADLVDMQKFEKDNKHFKYILTVIDVLSRYAWAEPLKDKKQETVIMAFQKILKDVADLCGTSPKKLWVDQGSEFINKQMKKFLQPIEVYHTYSENKAAPVERFNRTLKTRMWYKFTKYGTHKWVDRLPKLMKKYNTTVHSSIGMTPTKALANEDLLLQQQNVKEAKKAWKPPKLKVGDLVRLAKSKEAFTKGYEPGWTKELFTVAEVLATKPVTYRVKDSSGEMIEGSMYEQELQKSGISPNV